MKVIRVDNFDREGPGHDDKVEASNLSEEEARALAKKLNEQRGGEESYYRAVPDDYKLQVFES